MRESLTANIWPPSQIYLRLPSEKLTVPQAESSGTRLAAAVCGASYHAT